MVRRRSRIRSKLSRALFLEQWKMVISSSPSMTFSTGRMGNVKFSRVLEDNEKMFTDAKKRVEGFYPSCRIHSKCRSSCSLLDNKRCGKYVDIGDEKATGALRGKKQIMSK